MKAILVEGIEMPKATEDGMTTFVDLRIYSDGSVLAPCGENQIELKAKEIEE